MPHNIEEPLRGFIPALGILLPLLPFSDSLSIPPVLFFFSAAACSLARRRILTAEVLCDCGAYFHSSLISHIWAELLRAVSAGSLDSFEEQWALTGVLGSECPSGSLILTF